MVFFLWQSELRHLPMAKHFSWHKDYKMNEKVPIFFLSFTSIYLYKTRTVSQVTEHCSFHRRLVGGLTGF